MFRLAKILLLSLFIALATQECFSFQQTIIRGAVNDTTGMPVEKVNITLISSATGTFTDINGKFTLDVPKNGKDVSLLFSCVGYRSEKRTVKCDRDVIILDVTMRLETSRIGEVTVSSEKRFQQATLTRIPVKELRIFPSPSGSFEAILKTFPGVASNNELSSQYSVRGGSYDENLVYINDIEIFRPFLIRSGQQEGLSVVNPDLASSVNFSSGGYSATYGDKMSSVMDIRYKNPTGFQGSVSLGLLLSSAHVELSGRDNKLTLLTGIRYKSSKLMLKTLDSKGDYQPVFADIQSLLNYKTGKRSNLSLLVTYASNTYNYIPESRNSTFGSAAEAYQLYILFDGREKDRYRTWNTDLSWSIRTGNTNHKLSLSAFTTNEKESFDIRGYYSLGSLDKMQGTENFSDSLMNIGVGSYLTHARNKLSAIISSFSYKGENETGNIRINWGAKIRYDNFDDRIKEWTMIDSAGYSLPYDATSLKVSSLVSSANSLNSLQADIYAESTGKFMPGGKELLLNGGLRGLFNSFTGEILVTPRISARLKTGTNVAVWLAGGAYYQPPFYREMRFPDGSLNREIESQKSIHAVSGFSYDFTAGERPFRLTTEIYYKFLSDIIPYKLDNVRLIYTGENSARGYSRGIDMRLNGEFVPGTESWISLSLMDSKLETDDIEGKFPSPADQALSMNIFFQDYIPGYPTWRAHINISFATGLPVVSPFNDRFDQYHRLPPYRRVDLGITKVIKSRNPVSTPGNILNSFDEIVAGIEIFNLLDINNTISYFWIRTVNNLSGISRQYAVPDYLTGRSLNFKLTATF